MNLNMWSLDGAAKREGFDNYLTDLIQYKTIVSKHFLLVLAGY